MYVQLVEEPGRVDQIEGRWIERRPKGVPDDEPDRGWEVGVPEVLSHLLNDSLVRVQGCDGASLADPLAEALDPEQRGTACIENFETAQVT